MQKSLWINIKFWIYIHEFWATICFSRQKFKFNVIQMLFNVVKFNVS